ncbi:MAG: carboxypeptidase regulatory-like domain-containing protein [Deltaproteobacteria bacterium]|nr:carboxypeptidase regulatory-like domain-containing protein [Deltaproteobacteria bacterium]
MSGFLRIDPIVHRAALAGRALDTLAKVGLPGIAVRIVDGPPAWKTKFRGREVATTNADGWYRFLDLPAGTYRVEAAAPSSRYATAPKTIAVTATAASALDLELAPTALTGVITANGKPLAMARIRLVDSGEVAYTGATGGYTLSPLEPGTNRTIELSAQRHVTATVQVTLPRGVTTTRSAALAPV